LVGDLLPHLAHAGPHAALPTAVRLSSHVWRLHDGALVESVLMRYPKRVTICISSQAGCGMNCPFCATGQAGLTRNMSTAEIVDQVRCGRPLAARRRPGGLLPRLPPEALLPARGSADLGAVRRRTVVGDTAYGGTRMSNVVFMGMGEALANYKAGDRGDPAPDRPCARRLLGISARGITMSTVGLVPGIDKLAAEGIPVTLAFSLHAPDDELRDDAGPDQHPVESR
jgi:23S rRNA (adenine2503-C2)-methyltransferase